MPNIHPTALVAEGADLHPSVQVGPFCIIDAGAVIGANCTLDSHIRIYGTTRMGCNNRICHGVTLGSEPQDLSYNPDKARPLVIGDHNYFKENVDISCGVKTEQGTHIGNHNYFMVYAHIGHDCQIGDHNVVANSAAISGHVELAHHVFISGLVAIHQFCRVGPYVMIGGSTGVTQDIPPYVLASGQRARMIGLNIVGLRRNGFTPAQRKAIKHAYRVLYRSGLKRDEAIAQLQAIPDSLETQTIVDFITADSQRGLVAGSRGLAA